MVALSRESLIALIWASAALATPLVAKRIPSHDVELRHSGLEARQDAQCPQSYTSKNGMRFTTYCSKNNPWNDARDPFETPTMEACMEKCSRYWGNGEGCFGVVWREDKQCWLRNSTTGTANMDDQDGIHAALVDRDDMKPLNKDCPAADLSTHDMGNGLGYTVHCGKVIDDQDICWQGFPSCDQHPFRGFYHATSLEQCLNFCTKEHPLCRAVSYNPGLDIGFANCWPKTGFPPRTIVTPGSKLGVIHTATITSLEIVDTDCPEDNTYMGKDHKAFEIHCGKTNVGSNITSIHSQNLTACMDACSVSDEDCVGILFDSSYQDGYSNCYLQNTTSVISDEARATYAVLANTPLPSTSAPPGTPGESDESSSSKAWIAGPIVGGIAGLALIGFVLYWFRRKKNLTSGSASYNGTAGCHAAQLNELEDHPREMSAKPAIRYAHEASGSPKQIPQELPS